MIWPEEGKIIVAARRGEFNRGGQKRVIQRMWPGQKKGNLSDMARRGKYD